MIIKPFYAALNDRLPKDGQYLPLGKADESRLLNIIPETESLEDDNFMLLVLKDNMNEEHVKVRNRCGYLTIERGLDETEPAKFPPGTCVYFENTVAVTKWLICNYNCCDGPCPCVPATAAGFVLPNGQVGVAWEGVFIFSGDLPMECGVSVLPAWMSAEIGPNYVKLKGTPSGEGTYPLSASATNCSGSGSGPVLQLGTLTVTG